MGKSKKHLAAKNRKRKILEAAKTCFLRKGFADTTMEDVILESDTSKGGVYYYYKSTKDMLVDLMKDGSQYRYNVVTNYVDSNSNMEYEDMLVAILKDKFFDQNDYKTIYAMFLIEAQKNDDLKQLESEMMEESKRGYEIYVESIGMPELKCFSSDDFLALIKMMLVGTELLGIRQPLMSSDGLIRDIILGHLRRHSGYMGLKSNY